MATWDEEIREIIGTLPNDVFTLAEMYTFIPVLEVRHPENNNVDAKIRQTIQHLRESGEVEFVDRSGTYRRLETSRIAELSDLQRHRPDVRPDHPDVGAPDRAPLERRSALSYVVPAAEAREAIRVEQRLVERWEDALVARGHQVARWRIPTFSNSNLWTDLYDETSDVLFEAKSSATREAARLAIGQLLDYRFSLGRDDQHVSILLPEAPSTDVSALVAHLGMGLVYDSATGFVLDGLTTGWMRAT